MRLLGALLSVIAGSLDVISLIGLGLFTAHITGNLVLLIAHAVRGGAARVAPMLSVPVFIAVLGVTRMFVSGLHPIGLASLRPLLALQFLLLAGCLAVAVAAGPNTDPNAASTILAGMLGVSAMAVQNALGHVSLKAMPPTAVMTGNVTRLTLDVVEILLGRDSIGASETRRRARNTWPTVAGFAVGCGLGAACVAGFGRWSLALPAGLALFALAMAPEASRRTIALPVNAPSAREGSWTGGSRAWRRRGRSPADASARTLP
jgi:uncharacterized membrane protein YoaK (UPF0700 family)